MKRKLLPLGLALVAGLLTGCTTFLESMEGTVAGKTAYYNIKKHWTDPASDSRIYDLPAERMIQAVRSVLRARGLTVIQREVEDEEPATELIAEKPLASEPMNPEIMVIVKPLSTSRCQVEVQVRSVRPGRSFEDDQFLSRELLKAVNQRVMWG